MGIFNTSSEIRMRRYAYSHNEISILSPSIFCLFALISHTAMGLVSKSVSLMVHIYRQAFLVRLYLGSVTCSNLRCRSGGGASIVPQGILLLCYSQLGSGILILNAGIADTIKGVIPTFGRTCPHSSRSQDWRWGESVSLGSTNLLTSVPEQSVNMWQKYI
jgi:hypothetical protein